ncbi:hypothetical protein H0H87_008283 [Tephrocybe sp. NHM501043]|nr:hypothetical protein H0H87_008283 [Tephrocybe sp. NHM501043]
MVLQCRCAALALFALASLVAAEVHVYEPPALYNRSTTFQLKAGGKKVPVLTHRAYDYAHFAADVGIDIEVNLLEKVPLKSISIVASRFDYNNKPRLHKNTVSWKLNDHKYFILKIDGAHELIVAVDPPETNVPPATGPNIFNVAAAPYKADKLGGRLTTHAFEAAIAAAGQSKREDPIIYVPAGVYFIGNLVLPSKSSLYLAPGAVLRFTGNSKDYRQDWELDGEGRSGTYWISTAHNSTDIKIFGRGTIDGEASSHIDDHFTPMLIVPVLTSRFSIDGPLLRDSGSTALNIIHSNSVDVRNLKVFNSIDDVEDNGAVDIVESQNVTVSDVIAIATADTYTAKATKPAKKKVPAVPGGLQPLKDILFQNCLGWTANYGFKVGQGALSDMTNIKFYNSTVYEAAVGMGIHKKWGPGTASNITFENMIIKSTSYTTSILGGMVGAWIALFIEDGKAGVGPITDILVKNALVMRSGGSRPLIRGVEGAEVSNVQLRNVWLPKGEHPAGSLEDLGLNNLKFTHNITVVDAIHHSHHHAKASKPETQVALGENGSA